MLPFTISLRGGVPIHDQVVYAVTRAVVTGQLRDGDAFPSVRAISQELRINPNTAHKIVATLVEQGLLAVRPGIGTVVSGEGEKASGEKRRRIDDQIERLLIESKRAGMTLPDVLALVRRQWSTIVRRTG